jgi:hypothetical protein
MGPVDLADELKPLNLQLNPPIYYYQGLIYMYFLKVLPAPGGIHQLYKAREPLLATCVLV